jgi:Ca-activated chloride channel homolog
MKLLSLILVASLLSVDPTKISKVNKLKSEAKSAYLAGDMKTAIEKYKMLVDSLHVNEEEVAMNLANAYFNTNDTTSALSHYQPLSVSTNSKIKSWANQQMGVVSNRQGKFEEALNYFKQAMKAEPENEQARYNYEMVKKKLEEQKKKEQQQNKDKNNQDKKDDQKKDQNKDQKDQQNKDQNKDQKDKQDQKDKKDQQNKDKKDQQKKDQKDKQDQKDKDQKEKEQKEKEQQQKEQEKKDQQNKDNKNKPDPSLSEKLKEMKISEEKAKMILEAMKNQEIQYLQQNKRKATKAREKGKPDW